MTSLSTSFPFILWLCIRGGSFPWSERECYFEVLQLVETVSLWYGRSQSEMATQSIMDAVLWMPEVPVNISMPKWSMDGHGIKAVDTQALMVLPGLEDEWWSLWLENEDELVHLKSKLFLYSLGSQGLFPPPTSHCMWTLPMTLDKVILLSKGSHGKRLSWELLPTIVQRS